jgi:hypothetical protein
MTPGKTIVSVALASLALLVTRDASPQRRKRERRDDAPASATAEVGADGATAGAAGEEREGADSERDDWIPYALRDDVELNARWWSAELFGSTFAFDLRGQGMVTPNVGVGFTLPWTFNVGDGRDPIAALGNPTLDVHYAARVDIVTWHVGGGLSAPLASIEDDSGAYRFAAIFATNALATYDAHLFIPTFMPLRAFGGVEIRPNHIMSIRLGLSPDFLIPIEGNDFEVLLQEYADLIAISDSGFGGGVRLQGVHPLTSDGDLAQLSAEPYLAYDDRESFFMKLGLLMALDTPAGFAFDTGKVATLHLGIGGYLDGNGGDSF